MRSKVTTILGIFAGLALGILAMYGIWRAILPYQSIIGVVDLPEKHDTSCERDTDCMVSQATCSCGRCYNSIRHDNMCAVICEVDEQVQCFCVEGQCRSSANGVRPTISVVERATDAVSGGDHSKLRQLLPDLAKTPHGLEEMLYISIRQEDSEAAKIVIKAGANPALGIPHAQPLIHYAVLNASKGWVDLLLNAGADPYATAGQQTVWSSAMRAQKLTGLDALLRRGVDPCREHRGISPIVRIAKTIEQANGSVSRQALQSLSVAWSKCGSGEFPLARRL